jgi:phosphoglycolate phosphatase
VPRFDAVLFDLDGTLTDPRVAITSSIAYAMHEVGREAPPADELLWCIGPPIRQNLAKLLATDDAALIERAALAYLHRYEIHGVDETTKYPGIDTMLDRIQASSARIYLATTKWSDIADTVLKAFALRDYFTDVFGSRHDGSLADKRELLAHIIQTTGINPARSVMIGDREHDIIGAKSNRIYAIGVTYGYGSREELTAAGADLLCDSPEDLPLMVFENRSVR